MKMNGIEVKDGENVCRMLPLHFSHPREPEKRLATFYVVSSPPDYYLEPRMLDIDYRTALLLCDDPKGMAFCEDKIFLRSDWAKKWRPNLSQFIDVAIQVVMKGDQSQ